MRPNFRELGACYTNRTGVSHSIVEFPLKSLKITKEGFFTDGSFELHGVNGEEWSSSFHECTKPTFEIDESKNDVIARIYLRVVVVDCDGGRSFTVKIIGPVQKLEFFRRRILEAYGHVFVQPITAS